ncbi:cell division protein ZapA [Telmatospirillum sp. J64-1]|uniref:cell division protein ZapA n=1 Tax=Telmatospirillum sp. J64-1 TaxID=2502183 RepID=UPI00163D3E91|nr:cell division protein ZapA [Telmatospirillum sp. J64-1]
MAALTISIAGRDYVVACPDGQEDHVRELSREVDERAQKLTQQVGPTADTRLLVMVALLMADEMREIQKNASGGLTERLGELDESFASGIDALAGRIDAIAQALQKS